VLTWPQKLGQANGERQLRMSNGSFIDVTNGILDDGGLIGGLVDSRMSPPTNETGNSTWWFDGDYSVVGQGAKCNTTMMCEYAYVASCISNTTSVIWNLTSLSEFYPNKSVVAPVVATQQYEDPSCSAWYLMAPFVSVGDSICFSPTTAALGTYWNETYMKSASSYECVSTPQYQWGFSYEWLLLACCINSFWLLGTWILWADASVRSELCRKGRRLGTWRAILDLSESISRDLGPDTCAYSSNELSKALKDKKARYVVSMGTGNMLHHGLSSDELPYAGKVRLRWNQKYGASSDA